LTFSTVIILKLLPIYVDGYKKSVFFLLLTVNISIAMILFIE